MPPKAPHFKLTIVGYNPPTWKQFRKYCKRRGTSPSRELAAFVEHVMARRTPLLSEGVREGEFDSFLERTARAGMAHR